MKKQKQKQKQKGISSSFGILIIVIVAIVAVGGALAYQYMWSPDESIEEIKTETPQDETVDWQTYRNEEYGFEFKLPVSWENYSIVTDEWGGHTQDDYGDVVIEEGAMISIRHPQWTSENPRQDIPIMVLTVNQWNSLLQEEFHIGAAPINPGELGRNDRYVFALPARYNYAFPTGFEETDKILQNKPLEGF